MRRVWVAVLAGQRRRPPSAERHDRARRRDGPETEIAALLARPGDKRGPLRIFGDGSTIVANVDFGDRTGESSWVAGCALHDGQ